MQYDGNFVMYRSDGAVRFATGRYGNFMAMQGDGNFVEYISPSTAVWATGTQGRLGSYLAVQNDGNLVIYQPDGTPVWAIGVDPGFDNGPSATGDVVARDLAYKGLGFVGHVGIWTGSNVAEVVSGQVNAVRYVSWQAFKSASSSWPTAHPNIPGHLIYYCTTPSCAYYNGSNYTAGITARMAIAARANQIFLIGADYTLGGIPTIAEPAYPGEPAIRGAYRCDTFVVDVFQFTQGWNMYHPIPGAWQTRMTNLNNMPKTPSSVWNALKN